MSCAALVAVGLHLVSWHSNDSYNNINPGIYARSSCGFVDDGARIQDGVQLGGYYNSERAWSFYAAYVLDVYPFDTAPWLGFFGSIGVASGYHGRTLLPLALAGLNVKPAQDWTVKLGYAPEVAKLNDTHLITMTVQYDLPDDAKGFGW